LDKETILGNGDYGDVFLGEWNSKRVAVKQIKLSEMKTQKQEDELTLMRLDHPNVVKLLHVEDDSTYRQI
jgi:serine/threonine-protein kinase/endoribonuclease IRE1